MLTSLTQKRIPAAQSGQTTAGRQAAQPGAGAPNSAMTSLWEQSAPGYATPGLAEQMQARLAGQKGEPPQICRTGEETPSSPVLFFCPPGGRCLPKFPKPPKLLPFCGYFQHIYPQVNNIVC